MQLTQQQIERNASIMNERSFRMREQSALLPHDNNNNDNENSNTNYDDVIGVDPSQLNENETAESDDDDDDNLENSEESDEADSSVEREENRSESQASTNIDNNNNTIPRHIQMQIVQQLMQRFDLPPGSSILLSRQAGTGMIQARIQRRMNDDDDDDDQDATENTTDTSHPHRSSNRSIEVEVVPQSSLQEMSQNRQPPSGPPIIDFHGRPRDMGGGGGRVRISLSPRAVHSTGPLPSHSARSQQQQQQQPTSPRRVQLPPLRPIVLADSQQSFHENTDDDDDEMDHLERFRCSICYEYLTKPASCGSCSNRFCLHCLEKVFHATPSSSSSPKLCPTCRNPMTKIHPDRQLWKEMKAFPKIPCRFDGCQAMLPLVGVRHHEKVHCPRVKLACRYQPFGCTWKGYRGDLQQHEETECALHKVSALVHEHRVLREQFQRSTMDMNRRMQGLAQMVEYQRVALRQVNRMSPSNPLHLITCVMSIICVPAFVVQGKDSWFDMWGPAEARAAVFNFCTLFPTLLLVCRFLLNEYMTAMTILHSPSFSIFKADQTSRLETFMDAVVTLVAMLLVVALIIVCFTVDNKSSREWRTYKVPRTKWEGRYVLHIVTFAFGLLYNLMFDIAGDAFTAAFLFVVLSIATTLLSNVTAAFSLKLAGARNERSGVECGRAAIPLMFGLRYGFLFYMLNPVPCVGAIALVYSLEKSNFKLVSITLHHEEVFFSALSRLGSIACLVAAVSLDVHSVIYYNGRESAYSDWLLSVTLLLVINLMLSRFSELFTVVGRYLHRSAVVTLQRHTQQNPVLLGLMILGLSSCCLSILAIFLHNDA